MRRLAAILDNAAVSFYRIVNNRWYRAPLGDRARATPEVYQTLARETAARKYDEVEQYEHEAGFAINAGWLNELARLTQITIKKSELSYAHGRVLYAALRRTIADRGIRNINILETGTARGFSSVVMAKALADADVAGKIVTCDVLPHNQEMYWNSITDHSGPRTRAKLLIDYRDLAERYIVWLQGYTRVLVPALQFGRLHFVFLDGAHTYEDVMREYDAVQPQQQAGDVIVFDDYSSGLFPGVVKAVDEICAKHNYGKRVIGGGGERRYVVATKL